jgi:hypothetical protein
VTFGERVWDENPSNVQPSNASRGLVVSTALPLQAWVGGRARTKGSLDHIGHGRMRENIAGSKAWRSTVVETVVRTLGGSFGPGGPSGWWEAADGPLAASLTVYLSRPASGPMASAPYPTSIRTGDLDKLQRNVGDALTDTGVIADDSLIAHWSAWKLWATTGQQVGALIRVWDLSEPQALTGLDAGTVSAQVGP